MKWNTVWSEKLTGALSRYRWPLLILLLGLVLMLIPSGKKEQASSQPITAETEPARIDDADYCRQTEARLEKILSRIEGAGSVSVMLTLKSGPATQYQSDSVNSSRTDGSDTQSESEKKTVILSRGSSYNEAAVVKTEYPAFQGALIVSQGADDAAVRYRLLSAVAALLGLGTDQITVVKMK